jgi:hypothetical protein
MTTAGRFVVTAPEGRNAKCVVAPRRSRAAAAGYSSGTAMPKVPFAETDSTMHRAGYGAAATATTAGTPSVNPATSLGTAPAAILLRRLRLRR